MGKLVELPGGFYKAANLIADAQRCYNLYPEVNPKGAPVRLTNYLTPGLVTLANPGVTIKCRGAYKATNGQLFEVVGSTVYYTDAGFVRHSLGSIAALTTPVLMSDNGIVVVIVDGTASGYVVNLTTHAFSTISDPAFYGSTGVSYTDTYFVFNRPGTTQWYLSPQFWDGVSPFDALDIADKVGGADNINTIICMKEDIWVLGEFTSQVYYNAGGVDFAFAPISGVFIEHGVQASYSVAQTDLSIFWLTKDDDGTAMVVMGKDYNVSRVSTHAIETLLSKMTVTSDAIGMIYQQGGHTFYILTFPSEDKTITYDLASGLWHERGWNDDNGEEHRIRGNTCATAYGKTLMGDWENGKLYHLDPETYTDAGDPIVRRRGFPHIVNGGNLLSYKQFVAYMAAGSADAVLTDDEPTVSLRWSDNGGFSWGDPIQMPMGATGQYGRQIQARQLGMGRDRVFELFWSAPYATALQGAFVEADPAAS
jgi:hypothetical protein